MRSILVYEYLSGGGLDQPGHSLVHPVDAALLDEGLAMRDALLVDLAQAASSSNWALRCAAGRGVPRPRGAITVESHPGESAPAFLRRAAAGCDGVWVVAPETGGVLAALAAAVEPSRWIGCAREAIALCSSKAATSERLAAAGVVTPHAVTDATAWIVKPDDGAGGLAMRRHATPAAAADDLSARALGGQRAVLEPWVDGDALSLSLHCDAGACTLLAINRQQIATAAGGRVQYLGVTPAALPLDGPQGRALRALAQAVALAVPGLAGWVGVDLVWHPARGPVVIEINPRLTGAYIGVSAALGRCVAAEVLTAWLARSAP